MSADHKRPLFAFVVIAVMCVLIIANAIRSEAVVGILQHGGWRVVAGVEFISIGTVHDRGRQRPEADPPFPVTTRAATPAAAAAPGRHGLRGRLRPARGAAPVAGRSTPSAGPRPIPGGRSRQAGAAGHGQGHGQGHDRATGQPAGSREAVHVRGPRSARRPTGQAETGEDPGELALDQAGPQLQRRRAARGPARAGRPPGRSTSARSTATRAPRGARSHGRSKHHGHGFTGNPGHPKHHGHGHAHRGARQD